MKLFTITTFLCLLFISNLFAQTEEPTTSSQLSLDQCIQIALENNSQLKNAKRNVEIAKSGITSSYSSILPSIDASLRRGKYHAGVSNYLTDVPVEYEQSTVNREVYDINNPESVIGFIPYSVTGKPTRYEQQVIDQDSYERESNSFNISVSQNVFDGGRWWNRIRQARSNKEASEYDRENTRQQIVLMVKEQYYNVLKQIALLHVSEQSHQSYEEQYKKSKSMYEIGSVAQSDVYKAQASLGTAKSNLIKQKNAVVIAKYNLNFVMGRDPRTELEIIEAAEEAEVPEIMDSQLNEIIERNPEVKALKANIDYRKFGYKIAKSGFWPSFYLGAEYSRSHSEFDRVYKDYDKNYSWYIGGGINFNLFNGFSDKANVEIGKLNYLNAQENFLERKRKLKAEIAEYSLKLEANKELIETNKESLISAKEDFRLQSEKYRVGSGTLIEVLDARVNLTQAQSDLISAKYDALIAQAQLEAAMGRLK